MSVGPRLDVGYLTHPGRVRQRNEDNFALPPADLSAEVLAAKGLLYLVADGMGGHQGGQRASQAAAQRIAQEYYRDPSPDAQRSLARAIHIANGDIYQQAQHTPGLEKMGTTLTAVVVKGWELLVANVGDSRTYLVRGGSALQLTQDHSLIAQGLRDGTVTPDQVASHPYRGVITRALGSQAEVQPDFFQRQLQPGDALLLCSDGLTNEVDDRTIAATIAQSKSAQEATGRLVDQANQHGGNDNITTIVVGFNSARPAAAARPTRKATVPPWLFLAAGGLAAVALVLAVFLAFSGPGPKATPTLVAQATPAATEPAITTTVTAGSVVSETSALNSGAVSTSTANTYTLPISGTTTVEANLATATLMPTPTQKPQSSTKPPATPTKGPTATPTPPHYPAPVPDEPDNGAMIKDAETVTLKWHWNGTLGSDEHFDVRVWREGQEHLGVAWVEEPSYTLRIQDQPSRLVEPDPNGTYYWAIAVVRGQGGQVYKVLSAESSERWFTWQPPSSKTPKGGHREEPPGQQPVEPGTNPEPPPPSLQTGDLARALRVVRPAMPVDKCQKLEDLELAGPITGTVGSSYLFTATVAPPTATLPITYTWQATDQVSTTHHTDDTTDTISFNWLTAGAKVITVTAANACGAPVTKTHPVQVSASIYLPLAMRDYFLDPYEPNDTVGQAYGPLAGGQAYVSYIHHGDPDDFYYIEFTSLNPIHVQLAVPDALDLDLYIYDVDRKPVAKSNMSGYGVDEAVTFTPKKAVRHYVRVYPYAGWSQTESYTLIVTFGSGIPAEGELLPSGLRNPQPPQPVVGR